MKDRTLRDFVIDWAIVLGFWGIPTLLAIAFGPNS